MEVDRIKICDIISDMLDKPDSVGIYHTSTAYTRLEHYIDQVRNEAIGATHAWACINLDKDIDPRVAHCPAMLDDIREELAV